MTNSAARHYSGIDVLRGWAALLVVVYHVIEHGKWVTFPTHGPLKQFRIGWLGVDLFLVISGFVITLAVVGGMRRDRTISDFRKNFAIRRVARILPLYVLTILVFLFTVQPALLLIPARELAVHLGAHAVFLHNLSPKTHGSIDGPNWSVALEMQFYLLMLLIGPWLVRRVHPAILFVFFAGIAITFRAVLFATVGDQLSPAELSIYSTQLPGTLDEFGVGIGLALLFVKAGPTSRIFRPTWTAFAAWSVAAIAGTSIMLTIYWPRAIYWDNWAMVVFWRTGIGVAFGAAVVAFALLPGVLVRVSRPLRYLGEISYGIYLWHLPVLLSLVGIGLQGDLRLLGLTLVGTIALAAMTWHLMEKPLLERASRRIRAGVGADTGPKSVTSANGDQLIPIPAASTGQDRLN